MEYHPISTRAQSRLHQFGKKVLPGIFLGYAFIVVGIWKGDILIADLGKVGCIRNLTSKNRCERSIDITKGRRNHIPSCRWYRKIVRKRLRIPRTHSMAGTIRKE